MRFDRIPTLAYPLWKLGWNSKAFLSTATHDAFGPPPSIPTRRVVVTGLGLVTPLGVGLHHVWEALTAGKTAVRQLQPEDLPEVRDTLI